MTLEFAQREARRRTEVLGKSHYVYQSGINLDEFIVLDRKARGYWYVLVDSFEPYQVQGRIEGVIHV